MKRNSNSYSVYRVTARDTLTQGNVSTPSNDAQPATDVVVESPRERKQRQWAEFIESLSKHLEYQKQQRRANPAPLAAKVMPTQATRVQHPKRFPNSVMGY